MVDFKENNGDLVISNDHAQIVTGSDAIEQNLNQMLNFFLGESQFARKAGIPYFQKILGQKPRYSVIKTLFRRACGLVPGVTAVNNVLLNYNQRTRQLDVRIRCTTIDGEVIYTNELII